MIRLNLRPKQPDPCGEALLDQAEVLEELGFTIVCAWCKKDLGTKPGGTGVTHGVCPACLARIRAELAAGKAV